ncbi:hypothetical protein [Vagococcus carniphilus]|uniref:Uncharacterized protein n=1 Tax=Vagococcus carniphilus TaxID=218144 RepID=A0AAW8U4K2_9ENTE|nr:hypothetical protein [Vagococcus carniphilus]MDT2814716.1 hypothetical protein [Vagococcus carniphilus]MDT2832036.1 hypothetical protein [Vagococcus carniphilus]MDT2834560.1 hypothetical protein [Vagococcus carniphilus]MDT2840823.1 hypothetical protein [Vagococcus carniphilus]MDT2855487.1 hypothetical protein [Vagococcus carniphilus]
MNQSKELTKKIMIISVAMMVIGLGVATLGYSMSGFDYTKYSTNHKRWYQVLSVPR